MRVLAAAGAVVSMLLCSSALGACPPPPHPNWLGLLGPIANCGCPNSPPAAQALAQAAQYLAGFDPAAGYNPPPAGDITAIPPTDPDLHAITQNLQDALSLAPPHFLVRLCKDNRYLLVQTDIGGYKSAYAFWQTKVQAGGNQPVRFISIPKDVVKNPPQFKAYEADLITGVINDNNGPTVSYPITVTTNFDGTSNSQPLALLAIIAHEEGHQIAQRVLLKSGDKHASCSVNTHFEDYTWNPNTMLPPFHGFGEAVSTAHHSISDPFPMDIYAALRANNLSTANGDMNYLYADGNFSGVFGALAPDEDIAETHRYHVLRNNTVQPLTITLTLPNGTQYNVMANLKTAGSRNAAKEACINTGVDTDD